jgi:hypothetical protein
VNDNIRLGAKLDLCISHDASVLGNADAEGPQTSGIPILEASEDRISPATGGIYASLRQADALQTC